jgi:hypothetical protein
MDCPIYEVAGIAAVKVLMRSRESALDYQHLAKCNIFLFNPLRSEKK